MEIITCAFLLMGGCTVATVGVGCDSVQEFTVDGSWQAPDFDLEINDLGGRLNGEYVNEPHSYGLVRGTAQDGYYHLLLYRYIAPNRIDDKITHEFRLVLSGNTLSSEAITFTRR